MNNAITFSKLIEVRDRIKKDKIIEKGLLEIIKPNLTINTEIKIGNILVNFKEYFSMRIDSKTLKIEDPETFDRFSKEVRSEKLTLKVIG